jgi:hypothetical protein
MGQDKFDTDRGVKQTQKSGAKECLEPWVIKFVWQAKRKGTHGTQPVVIWPPAAFADGLGTPMIGIQRIAHDSDGCFCGQSWFRHSVKMYRPTTENIAALILPTWKYTIKKFSQDDCDEVLALSPKLSRPTARPPRMTVK